MECAYCKSEKFKKIDLKSKIYDGDIQEFIIKATSYPYVNKSIEIFACASCGILQLKIHEDGKNELDLL